MTDIKKPSKIFVFLDMREDSVNWSNFLQFMDGYDPYEPSTGEETNVPSAAEPSDPKLVA